MAWGDTKLSSPTYGLDTMHPSRRSLPFPLNCQLVRVGTADYGGGSDQVSFRNSEAQNSLTLLMVFVLVMKTGTLR